MAPKPIVISCGEPAGIGPEIAADAWDALRETIPMVWIGDPRHLPKGTPVVEVPSMADAAGLCPTHLPVLPLDFGSPATLGIPKASHAQGVITAIERGVALVQSGEARALCTAPIHKAALVDGAAFVYPGHTEFLAALAHVDDVVMMLAGPQLRVVPVTIHIALQEVTAHLTPELLAQTIRITHAALQADFGITAPRIAVAGLNPHAGEDGKMGRDEITLITPVLEQLRAEGLDITGPLSADTMFHDRARTTYDVAVCMYHDQALIPIKTLGFDTGVNITLGLPFIRTSPDHGTAFDIAGKGSASPVSMIEAITVAARMAEARDG